MDAGISDHGWPGVGGPSNWARIYVTFQFCIGVEILRKRVTRVGSGAFSIYLPKKWIDGWDEAQQESREVLLRYIGKSILVSPAIQRRANQATVAVEKRTVCLHLLSAYVRGNDEADLTPASGAFDNDCMSAARDFLRHLDERLAATVTPERIGYRLRPDLPAPSTGGIDLLWMMGAKIREMLGLARDCVEAYAVDPDRTLHGLRLLRDTHEEDVSRIFHQALRLVATLELPLESVSEYQLLGMAASDLHQVSGQILVVADVLLDAYGLERSDLDYPRNHLLEKIERPAVPTGVARALRRAAVLAFGALDGLVHDLLAAMAKRDASALLQVHDRATQTQKELQDRIFGAVVEHWGSDTDPAEGIAAHGASRIGTALSNMLDEVGAIAETTSAIMAAGGPETEDQL